MQQYKLHKKFFLYEKLCQKAGIDESQYSSIVYKRLEKIKNFDSLQADLKLSKSTLYRWKKSYKKHGLAGLEIESKRPNNVRKPEKTPALVREVLYLRRKKPLYGKAKLAVF